MTTTPGPVGTTPTVPTTPGPSGATGGGTGHPAKVVRLARLARLAAAGRRVNLAQAARRVRRNQHRRGRSRDRCPAVTILVRRAATPPRAPAVVKHRSRTPAPHRRLAKTVRAPAAVL